MYDLIISKLPERDFFTGYMTAAVITALILLIIAEYKLNLRMIIIAAIASVCTATAGIGGKIAGKIIYGAMLDPAGFINNFGVYEGTHFIGRAIYIILLSFILWKIIMRRDSGTFGKTGYGRFSDILSLYMFVHVLIVRTGCLSAGCCYGKPYNGLFSVIATGVPYSVMPAVYTEMVITAIAFAVGIVMFIRKRNVFVIFGIGYPLAVFVSEFMYDRMGSVYVCGLTGAQWLALLLAAMCIVISQCIPEKKSRFIFKQIR